VVHGDFAECLARTPPDGFAYLDPPYYLKGDELYVHGMPPAEHVRLADTLRAAAFDWVLSYDDHPEVRRLYGGWADIRSFEMTATIDTKRGAGRRRKNSELVITYQRQEAAAVPGVETVRAA
jgi:DNA adenine methylase